MDEPAGCKDVSGVNSDACQLGAEEERILTSFARRLIEIAAVTSARGPAAAVVFDDDVKVKDKRLFVRDLEARRLLKASLDSSASPVGSQSLIAEPIIVQCRNKLPVILRIWPFEGAAHSPEQEVRALVTLNALGPKPGPPAAILAKTFQLTTPEAKLACIIARGAPLPIAAQELKISREAARNNCSTFSIPICSNPLILNGVLIDQRIPYDWDGSRF